jgi:hypothetical protein
MSVLSQGVLAMFAPNQSLNRTPGSIVALRVSPDGGAGQFNRYVSYE